MVDRPLSWLGTSLEDVRRFPVDARRQVGHELRIVQSGLMPSDWKAMPAAGVGTYEIRVHTRLEHRVLYVAKFAEAIYVLHAFEKRTRRTSKADLLMARQRYAELIRLRKGSGRW